ncbi:MAG: 4Fe-4S binding protein, partial [Myxococcota bacterium]
MFRRPHTVQYPDKIEKDKELIQNRFRGLLEVDLSICTGCLACQRACPIGVIMIEVSRGTERYITRFDIDAGKCMYCGLCTESCPTGAIRHTKEFAFSTYDIRKLILHYVNEPVKPYKPQKETVLNLENSGKFVAEIVKGRESEYKRYIVPQLNLEDSSGSKEKV